MAISRNQTFHVIVFTDGERREGLFKIMNTGSDEVPVLFVQEVQTGSVFPMTSIKELIPPTK